MEKIAVEHEDPTKGHEDRIAVVFIHGQGQQRPMEDVQELARVVWDAADKKGVRRTFTVPDARFGLADLGRVTTEAGKSPRVDFFELYWAHLMSGNRLKHFLAWFSELQARPRRDAPHGLLPVRQWVIRTIESVTLLSLLLSFAVALLLPPPPDGLTTAQLQSATFGLGGWLPTPADVTVYAMALAAASILSASAMLIINEISGGSAKRRRHATLLGLKAKAVVSVGQVWPLIAISVILVTLMVHVFIWQGPFLQWADARLLLLTGVIISALLMTFRSYMAAALVLSCGTAALALACALFGGISQDNLWRYGDNVGPASCWLINWFTYHFGQTHLPGDMDNNLGFAFYTIFSFAGVWFTLGLNASISAARHWYQRLFWTALTFVVAAAVGWWMAFPLYGGHMLLPWAIYAGGITLVTITVFGGAVISLASQAFLVPVMTDSARYFSRDPEHIDARQKIREAGVKLLDKLHDPKAKYNRIIVVAHSLGSAVGYELLTDYWARQSGAYVFREGDAAATALANVEQAAHNLYSATSERQQTDARAAYRAAQREFSRTLRSMALTQTNFGFDQGKTWLISDFITLGSPLTHASLLLAEGRDALWEKQVARTIANCPPTLYDDNNKLDLEQGRARFKGWDGQMRPIHSAVFSAVRWTNHFFKAGAWIVLGDPIGGPIASAKPEGGRKIDPSKCGDLGVGVLDVSVDRIGTGKLFAHNEYWRSDLSTELLNAHLTGEQPKPQHLVALIEAMDLNDAGASANAAQRAGAVESGRGALA